MLLTAPPVGSSGLSSDTLVDTTEISDITNLILPSVPSGVILYYFDENSVSIAPDYVYSKTGKSYLKPLNTRFLYVATNNSDVTVQVMYGNTTYA